MSTSGEYTRHFIGGPRDGDTETIYGQNAEFPTVWEFGAVGAAKVGDFLSDLRDEVESGGIPDTVPMPPIVFAEYALTAVDGARLTYTATGNTKLPDRES